MSHRPIGRRTFLKTTALAGLGGAIRVSTPFLFVSLGECLTEKSGRINLGLEGTLVLGAIAGYGTAYECNSAWIGLLAAGVVGCLFGALHGWLCSFERVNDIAIGIALTLLIMILTSSPSRVLAGAPSELSITK